MSNPVNSVVRWVHNQSMKIKSPQSSQFVASAGEQYNKNWVHPPDTLIYGQVEYSVKFLGEVEVHQAKGTQVIKEAIQKIRFELQVKRSQGFKIPRVELRVNVDGLNIVDTKSKMVLYKYPLHRISFCADDKQDKRVFSFIAKQADSDAHNCFVFLSDKLAEEITLTIGEAFDLAYRKFLENNGKDLELKKQSILLRKRNAELEKENAELKQRLHFYEKMNSCSNSETPPEPPSVDTLPGAKGLGGGSTNWKSFDASKLQEAPPASQNVSASPAILLSHPSNSTDRQRRRSSGSRLPASPNCGNKQLMDVISSNVPSVGRKLENLQLDKMDDLFDDNFNPRAGEQAASVPLYVNGSAAVNPINGHVTAAGAAKDAFGLDPFLLTGFTRGQIPTSVLSSDRTDHPTAEDMEKAISALDSRLAEIREGFSGGLTFGTDDFELSDLDPLNATVHTGVSSFGAQ